MRAMEVPGSAAWAWMTMKRITNFGTAGALVGASFLLLGCDREPDARTAMVTSEVAAEVDDRSADFEPAKAVDGDDDPRGKDSHDNGPDHERGNIDALGWADASTGTLVVPKVPKGEWTLEVRAQVGKHRAAWTQGPFDAEEVADAELDLDPPTEAFVKEAPNRPLRVMPRLVLRDADGEQLTQLALPALVMQRQGREVRFAQHATMPIELERSGNETLANADLPKSL